MVKTIEIKVEEIPQQGLELEEVIDEKNSELNTKEVIFIQPIKIEFFAEKIRNEVTVKGHINSQVKRCCVRCLEWYEEKIDKDFVKNYEVSHAKRIELWQDLREDLILDYPMKPLCREKCKGLCSECGKNLNEGNCEHHH